MAYGYVWTQTDASADSVHAGTTRGIRYGWLVSGGINNCINGNNNNHINNHNPQPHQKQ